MDRLVLLTYDYPPNNGGIARLCREIINCCKVTRLPYLVVTVGEGDDNDNCIVRINARRGLLELKILHFLRKNLRIGDVVLTGTFHPDGLIGVLSGFPTYFLAHGAEFLQGDSFFRKHIWSVYRKFILSLPKGIISNSFYTAGLVRECNHRAMVVPIPLAVDNHRFHPTLSKRRDGVLHLCSVSRLERFKGQDFLLETIGKLPVVYRNRISLEIAGKGPYRSQLESIVNEYGLQKQVTFLGFISDDELCDFYSRNDVFVLLTREESANRSVEGFGLVFLEAQACGTACIGTRSGGIPDAVCDGNGGWLIEQDNEDELKRLLTSLIDSISISEIEGNKARLRVENECTWSVYFNKLVSILK